MVSAHGHPAQTRGRGPGRVPGRDRAAGGRKAVRVLAVPGLHHEAPKLDRPPNAGPPGTCRAVWARRARPRRAGARPPGRSRVERASAPAVARDDAPPALCFGHDAGRPCEPRGRCACLRHCRSPLTARPDRRRPMGRARPGSRPGCTTGRRGRRGDHRACVAGGPCARLAGIPDTAAGRSAAVIGRRRFPGTSGLPGKRRVWCAHGARARSRPDRRARALDTARRHRRRRRGNRHVHDHREQGSPARHAEVVRAQLGRS